MCKSRGVSWYSSWQVHFALAPLGSGPRHEPLQTWPRFPVYNRIRCLLPGLQNKHRTTCCWSLTCASQARFSHCLAICSSAVIRQPHVSVKRWERIIIFLLKIMTSENAESKAKYKTMVAEAAKHTFRVMALPTKFHLLSFYLSPCL